jgi:regulator of sigma E protease
LLPIPVLDGGHITLAIIERIMRRPVNVRILEFVQSGFAILLIGFMLYVTFFDVLDLGRGSGGSKPASAEQMKFPAAPEPSPAAVP